MTRLNSTLDMLERLSEQLSALYVVTMDNEDVQVKMYNFREQEMVEKFIKILLTINR